MLLFANIVYSQGINWRITGNNNINENNFLGTSNNHPLILKSNLQEGIRIFTDGTVGIGVAEQHYLLPRLDVNGNVLLRGDWTILPNGRLGIGTEFPLAQLHTTGTVRFENYSEGILRVDETGKLGVTPFGESLLWAKTEEGEHIYNTNEGIVGINTNVPGEHYSQHDRVSLDVRGDAFIGKPFVEDENENTGYLQIGYNGANSIIESHGDGTLLLNWYNNKKVTTGGDLNVLGGINLKERLSFTNAEENYDFLHEEETPAIFSSRYSSESSSLNVGSNWLVLQSGSLGNPRGIVFGTSTGDGNIHERMRIDGEGRVGIGTDAPQRTLHINGSILLSGDGDIDRSIFFTNGEATSTGEWGIEYISALNNNDAGLNFWKPWGSTNPANYVFFISNQGKVGIGTGRPEHKLDVCGTIRASEEVIVNQDGWCDFVFEPNYLLQPFSERIELIRTQKHLPNIRPENEILETGVPITETLRGLLQNVEEMYLYMEILENRINELEQENKQLYKTIENNYLEK